eukprot:12526958-Alexandrium_andersonii.AAC.1
MDRSNVSNLALHSSEWRVPAAGRRSRTRVPFKHPAVYPCSAACFCKATLEPSQPRGGRGWDG